MSKVPDPNARKKQVRRNVVDSITAVHEAGHVVARMLAFEDFGHSLDVFKADGLVHTLQPPRWLYDDGLTYPQGPISAPFFSYEMEMVSEELRKNYDRDWNTYMAKVLQVSKAAGVNIESWFALHVLQAVSGPIAQALASNRSFAETWGDMTKRTSSGWPKLPMWTSTRCLLLSTGWPPFRPTRWNNSKSGQLSPRWHRSCRRPGFCPGRRWSTSLSDGSGTVCIVRSVGRCGMWRRWNT
jgi:hypothetical protein